MAAPAAGAAGSGVESCGTAATPDIAALIAWLSARSSGHQEALADLRLVRVAVNQDYVGLDHPVTDGDEVAFFPPVTGG